MQKSKSSKKSNILVIAAHPDDEILGCGGSIIKLKKYNINVLFMTDGVSARKKNHEKIVERRNSSVRLFKKLGIKKTYFFQFS